MRNRLNWKDWSLTVKRTLVTAGIVILTVLSITLLALQREQQAFRSGLERQADLLLSAIEIGTADELYQLDADTISDMIKALGEQQEQILVTGRVYDRDGRIIADVETNAVTFSTESDPDGLRYLALDRVLFEWQADKLVASKSVILGNQRLGAISIGLPTDSLQSQLAIARVQGLVTAVIAVILGTLISLVVSRSVTQRLQSVADAAALVAVGDFSRQVVVDSQDEVGQMAAAFNRMSAQLQATLASLEQRTLMVTAGAGISRRLSTLLETSELVFEVVNQIKTAFDYYHVHIYLLDETGKNLVMVGGTGEAGQAMLADGHRIEWGQGLVGRAAEMSLPVLVPDVHENAAWLPNPLLPETKAETAVPIISGDRTWGVLDVQHNVTGGLTQLDVDLLESIANQVAVALRNARLYEEAQEQVKREARMNEINQKILNTKDVQEAMQVAVREIGRATGASFASVRFTATEAENGR